MQSILMGVGIGLMPLLASLVFARTGVAQASQQTDYTPEHIAEEYIEEEVSFQSKGITLHGTVLTPGEAANQPQAANLPGIVLVHGAGPQSRANYRAEAEAFVRAGIVVLIYDKRTAGYSFLERSYALLAQDALAAVRVLHARPEVDSARVGLWGLSEGGWVAPLAASQSASQSTEVAFLITIAGTGVSPSQQEAWAKANRLRNAGVDGSLIHAHAVQFTRFAIDAGVFSEPHFDPVPILEQLTQPILAIWGEQDRTSPTRENLEIYRATLERSGHPHVTLRVIPAAGHAIRHTLDHGPTGRDAFAPGYVALMTGWIHQLEPAETVFEADAPPPQTTLSTPLAPVAWYESAWMQLVAFAVLFIAFAGYLLTGLFVWRRPAHRLPKPMQLPAHTLAWSGLICMVGAYSYFMYLLMNNEQDPGSLVAGRPLPWLLMQLLALGGTAAALVLLVGWWRVQGTLGGWTRFRLGLLLAGGLLFAPWAYYWGLLRP